MSLDDYIRNFLENPDEEDAAKERVRSLMASHLVTGVKLQRQGLLREAIREFAEEIDRPIYTDTDKEIVQTSYWHIGIAYRKLGEIENAKVALEKARELWKLYGVGTAPHYDLAEILIDQGKLDEAIEICQELLAHIPDGGVKQLLAKALTLKRGQ